MNQAENERPRGDQDDALEREIAEALGGQSIDDILDGTLPLPMPTGEDDRVEEGQLRTAVVAAVDSSAVLVELGGKDQGMVPLEQFEEVPAVGERIELTVTRYDRGEDLWVLSRKGAVERATWEDLSVGQVVEAFVDKSNKGGLEVTFNGIKAFMPISQISMYRVEDPGDFVGQKLRCQVVECHRREKRVIVSARAVQELEAEQKRQELLLTLAEGDILEGVVRQVMPFGAFVDLGGVDGLVHVSQMSYGRVEDPAALVQPGQTVKVMVLGIEDEGKRISLGMKQTTPDPWDSVEAKYPPGSLVTGVIANLQNFGAFCRIEDGVEALVPIGEITWGQRINHPSQVLQAGQTVHAIVLDIDLERRRMSLSIKQAQADPWSAASEAYPTGSEQVGRVSRIADFGAFVELGPGVEGLLHVSELSHQHVRRAEDVVQVGQTVRVRVLNVDEKARRISLSIKDLSAEESPAATAEDAPPARPRKRPLRGGLD